MSEPRFSYPNPPIVEAICQFHLAGQIEWNPATPGLLFSLLRADYPKTPEARGQVKAGFEMQPDSGSFQFSAGATQMIYGDESGRRLVVVNQESVSVNSLDPYEGWDSMSARALNVLEETADVVGVPTVEMVTLRYINRIQVPAPPLGQTLDLEDYFLIPMRGAQETRTTLTGFMQRTESLMNAEPSIGLACTFAAGEANDEEQAADQAVFILDLIVQQKFAEPKSFAEAVEAASRLKALENEEFEASITDKTRERFA